MFRCHLEKGPHRMLREPVQLIIGPDGELTLPLGLLAEAGLNPGQNVIAHSDGDGRIVLRRTSEAAEFLLSTGTL
jgi:bifunctional DNA-binding transcriptional regulator/antitoxin component of YhaV-PrlF toxin-antitoxin module